MSALSVSISSGSFTGFWFPTTEYAFLLPTSLLVTTISVIFLYFKSSLLFSEVISCVSTKSSVTTLLLSLYIFGSSLAFAILESVLVL